ncbi:MAG: glycosyltransferase family 4 protein [Bacteroidales bacterium]|nr:glycosyltransferase family 4 protein [Bacteroidales bacterium]
MKILVLSPRPLWPEHDGGTVATARCARGLAAAGAEVSVLAMKTEKHHDTDDGHGSMTPVELNSYSIVHVDTSIRLTAMMRNLIFSSGPYDISRFRSAAFSEAIHSSLINTHFDIIHCEGLTMAPYLEEIKRLTDAPVVLRAHNLEHRIREMMAASARSPVRRAYLSNLSHRLRSLEQKTAWMVDAIVPISEPDFTWFISAAGDKPVFLAETGTEEAGYLPEPAGGNLRVGFIGAMNWEPNIEGIKWFIKEVWPGVVKKMPDTTLHIAGRTLKKKDTILPGGKNIFIEGEVEDAIHFIRSNHVMIVPLFAGSGLRIKIIEAMSAGRPVVATPVAVEGLPVKSGRELFVATDAGTFSASLIKLLGDPSLRASTGINAVSLVNERYQNSAITSRLIEFYKNLIHDS